MTDVEVVLSEFATDSRMGCGEAISAQWVPRIVSDQPTISVPLKV